MDVDELRELNQLATQLKESLQEIAELWKNLPIADVLNTTTELANEVCKLAACLEAVSVAE